MRVALGVRPTLLRLACAGAVGLAACGIGDAQVMELDEGWSFRRMGDVEWLGATVPGDVHLDLLRSGRIPDPFDGANELDLQWIADEAWEYRTTFRVPGEMRAHRNVELVFEGLDTYATVLLNDTVVLEADNMFRTWDAPVGELLRPGENTLQVRFRSPLVVGRAAGERLPYALPAGNDRGDPPTRVFTRKAAYHYGWDWGPRFVSSGIWRPVRLRAWSGARIRDAWIEQRVLTEDRAEVAVHVEVATDTTLPAAVTATLRGHDVHEAAAPRVLRVGVDTLTVTLAIPEPRRWWPNGLAGAEGPYLYEVEVELEAGAWSDRATRRFGLRTVELVTEPDSVGESFFFRVNGVPVFMKGANTIPLDHFVTRASAERYRRFFEDVVAADMNMLRVWGGGIYEQDVFYDLADEYGILVWQDFMFANGMYPGDSAFLENVRREAEENVRRLRNHPSLALWCGNNEIDEGWHNWGWQQPYTPAQAARIWADYEEIFHRVLPNAVAQHDPGRPYWPSSPRLGWGHPESITEGDAHYWGLWHGWESFEEVATKLPRFMSEFGFQAYPPMATIEAFTAPEDRALGSPVMAVHQKARQGDERIRHYMEAWYDPPEDLAGFAYVSQVLQAEGMRTLLEAHRRAMPRTMGTLYWQLNDTWPVVSWSSIDALGRWKALHYAVRDAFAPVLVSPIVRGDTIEVYVVSDLLATAEGELSLRLIRFDGGERFTDRRTVPIPANGSRRVFAAPVATVLGAEPANAVVLEAVLKLDEEKRLRRLLYFAPPKALQLQDPGISAREEGGAVVLRADRLARHVQLSAPGLGVRFADNYFDLLPGEERVVRVLSLVGEEHLEGGELSRALEVRSLGDGRR